MSTVENGSKPDDDGYIHLLTFTRWNDKRTLVLYQKRRETSRFVTRAAEVGHMRAGASLAIEGAGEIKRTITSGRGTNPRYVQRAKVLRLLQRLQNRLRR